MSSELSPTEQYVRRAWNTLEYIAETFPEQYSKIVVVGGGALAIYLREVERVPWEHPSLLDGVGVDLDLLTDANTVIQMSNSLAEEGLVDVSLQLTNGYPEGFGFTLESPKDSDLLNFTFFDYDAKAPEITGEPMDTAGLYYGGGEHLRVPITTKVNGTHVMTPEWVLRWKATHRRPKDEDAIGSVLEANSQHRFLGEEAVRSIDRIHHNKTSQEALF